ncbi:hypothetical protein IP88_05015 [alpha proteobacterium AAP81b]|nr:hypothetical protein IP88_05015 [alpha proteobacterium AAP81b]
MIAARRLLADRRGAVAAETALIAVLYFSVLMSIGEFGRYAYIRNELVQMAYAGARCAGLRAVACSNAPSVSTDVRVYDAAKTQTYIISSAAARGITLQARNIQLTALATCSGLSGFVRVSISRRFGSPFLRAAGLDNVYINTSACFPQQS